MLKKILYVIGGILGFFILIGIIFSEEKKPPEISTAPAEEVEAVPLV